MVRMQGRILKKFKKYVGKVEKKNIFTFAKLYLNTDPPFDLSSTLPFA